MCPKAICRYTGVLLAQASTCVLLSLVGIRLAIRGFATGVAVTDSKGNALKICSVDSVGNVELKKSDDPVA